jgi:hypothetical protein
MNTEQLKNRISTRFKGYGHFEVTIQYRGKEYSSTTTNTMAIDRIGESARTPKEFYKTEKDALLSLYNECKRVNNLR